MEDADKAAGAIAVAPRVTLADIEDQIFGVFYQTGDHLLDNAEIRVASFDDQELYARARITTVCTIMMKNGFMVIGHSTPASAENYNADLGRQFAYNNARQQLWPLMAFVLKTRLHEGW